MNEDLQELKDFLSTPKDIAIIAHRNPDGDALGSAVGLRLYLESIGHSVKVVMPSSFPPVFDYMPTAAETIIFDQDKDLAREVLKNSEGICCLDFNSLDRVDKLGPVILESNAKILHVDHHLDPEPFADFVFSDTTASSTCELIFKLIEDLGDSKKITPELGMCLFTGIITDTGSFKYGTRPETYRVAGELKKAGVDDYYVQNIINNSLEEKHLRLLGHCLANRMEIMDDYGVAIMHLTKQDYIDYNIQRGDTEGIVNHMLMMKKIKVAAFITEQPTIVKLSLRSKGDISVQEIASQHFKGGGHKNASGAGVYASLDDVIRRFKKVVPNYIK